MANQPSAPDFETILASTIHDMKNSLGMLVNAIDGLALRLTGERPELHRELYQVQSEARRLNTDLVQLLSLYRMGRGEFSVNPREMVVSDLLYEAFYEFEAVFQYGGVAVDIDCDPELVWVFDDNLIMGVVRNALNNLVRYGRDRVRLAAAAEDDWLVIRIEDNGDGYPEAIMDLAGALTKSVDFRSSSTGLGLYFATEVTGSHVHQGRRGRIELTNGGSLGGGVFTIRLP